MPLRSGLWGEHTVSVLLPHGEEPIQVMSHSDVYLDSGELTTDGRSCLHWPLQYCSDTLSGSDPNESDLREMWCGNAAWKRPGYQTPFESAIRLRLTPEAA